MSATEKPKQPDWEVAYQVDLLQRREGEYKHWGQLHADWLRARADQVSPYDEDRDDDEQYRERTARLQECTRNLMLEPATQPWMIWDKITVLEHFLHGDGSCEWTDNRQVWLLAAIKADLMRHGIEGRNQ